MKKFLLTAAVAAITLAASAFNMSEANLNPAQLGSQMNLKKATPEMVNKLAQKTAATRAPKKISTPVTVASDLAGSYVWSYEMASSRAEDPTTVTGTEGTQNVLFYAADDAAGTFKIAGMFDAAITATLDLDSYSYPTFTISDEELVTYNTITVSGNSVALNCSIMGVFYYEGDDTNQAGWYFTDNLAFVIDNEIIWATNVWITRVISHVITSGYSQYEGYSLNPLWKPGSIMTEAETTFNGLTTYNYGEIDMATPAAISEDENYVVTVENFAGLADNPVHFTLEEGRTWTADHPVLFSNDNGDFVFYGLDADANNLLDVTGTGTDTELTFDCTWTGYDTETNYWLGQRNPATITLLDGKYVYPGEEPPVYYLIGSYNGWSEETMEELTYDENTGKYTITKAMDANAEFKLKDEDGNWIGAQSEGNFIVTEDQVVEGIAITMGAGDGYMNVQIPVAGEWTLTYDPEASTLTISGEWIEPAPKYYLIGSFNSWDAATMEELTLGDDGKYTITKAMDADAEFKLKDEDGNWIGAQSDGNFIVTKEQVQQGTAITMGAGDSYMNLQIPVAGEWTLTYDPEASTLVIAGEWPVENITVTGTVTDKDNQPLEGVTVTIAVVPAEAPAGLMREPAETTFTGTTDAEGNYSIEVTPVDGATYNATFEKNGYKTQTIENVDLTNMPAVTLEADDVVGIFDINGAKNVASVKFINAAGQVSNSAFNGLNIQVIRYTDGTIKTVKVVK